MPFVWRTDAALRKRGAWRFARSWSCTVLVLIRAPDQESGAQIFPESEQLGTLLFGDHRGRGWSTDSIAPVFNSSAATLHASHPAVITHWSRIEGTEATGACLLQEQRGHLRQSQLFLPVAPDVPGPPAAILGWQAAPNLWY